MRSSSASRFELLQWRRRASPDLSRRFCRLTLHIADVLPPLWDEAVGSGVCIEQSIQGIELNLLV